MNKYILTVLLMFLCVSSVQAGEMKMKAGEYDPKGEMVTVTAKGLVCEFCAKALEKVFLKQDAVAGINVDLTTKEITISLKEGKTLDDDVISKLVLDSGYNIESITR